MTESHFPTTWGANVLGDGAARFIQWMELGFYAATHSANLNESNSQAAPQRLGWHKKWSQWSGGFADGHAQHGYYNTRLVFGGMDATIWIPNWTPPTP